MESICDRVIQLKAEYAETLDRLASLHPGWDKENDVRLTVFYKIASVLNSTQHGLVHLINDLPYEDWWRGIHERFKVRRRLRITSRGSTRFVSGGAFSVHSRCLNAR